TALFAGIAVTWLPIARQPRPRGPDKVRATTSGATALLLQYAVVALTFAYVGWRGWDTWPAVDRHDDRRGEALVARLAAGAGEPDAVIVSSMDWQSENALLSSSRWERTNLPWLRLAEVLPQFPFFVRDNHELNRDVV